MDNYEVLSVAGEGSYGIVMKCRQKKTKKIVAIKKLIDVESDHYIKKMAFREIRILKKLQHDNLVKLLDVFKRKKRFYLVFEFLDRTILDDLEDNPNGLGEHSTKEYMFQLIRAVDYCHSKNVCQSSTLKVIHRDIKPENLLVSKNRILKLCDFGFARVVTNSNGNYTEYIATRWYRAPELLVRDRKYGKPVDIWAVGCVFAELLTGEPLFPGDSDIDQLYQITKKLGKLCHRHQELLNNIKKQNEIDELNRNCDTDSMNIVHALHNMFPSWSTLILNTVALCLHLDPFSRPTAAQLLNHECFEEHNFKEKFLTSFYLKVKKKPILKSPPLSEFELKCNSQSYTNFATQRTVSVMKAPSPSPAANTTVQILNSSSKSPNILNHEPLEEKQIHRTVNGPYVYNLTPVNVDKTCSYNQHSAIEFPRSSLFNQWHPFTTDLKFRNLNTNLERIQNNKNENTVQQLPKPEIVHLNKEKFSLLKNKSKIVPIKEVNLPLLQISSFK